MKLNIAIIIATFMSGKFSNPDIRRISSIVRAMSRKCIVWRFMYSIKSFQMTALFSFFPILQSYVLICNINKKTQYFVLFLKKVCFSNYSFYHNITPKNSNRNIHNFLQISNQRTAVKEQRYFFQKQ